MKRALYLLIAIFLMMVACDEPETGVKFKKVRIKKLYTMKVPTYMKKTDELNDDASLQYMSERREAYAIVIDEEKEAFVETFKLLNQYNDSLSAAENYKNVQVESFQEFVVDFKLYDESAEDFNGTPSYYAKIEGVVDNFPVTYFFRFVEGKETLYTILCWTEQRSKKTFGYTFSEVLKSFRELQ